MSDDFNEKLKKRLADEKEDAATIANLHAAYDHEVNALFDLIERDWLKESIDGNLLKVEKYMATYPTYAGNNELGNNLTITLGAQSLTLTPIGSPAIRIDSPKTGGFGVTKPREFKQNATKTGWGETRTIIDTPPPNVKFKPPSRQVFVPLTKESFEKFLAEEFGL